MTFLRAVAAEIPAAFGSACTTFGALGVLLFLHYALAGGLA